MKAEKDKTSQLETAKALLKTGVINEKEFENITAYFPSSICPPHLNRCSSAVINLTVLLNFIHCQIQAKPTSS